MPELDLPAAGLIEFRAAPITEPATHRYRVSLVRQHGGSAAEAVATLADLAVGADGYVHCYADAARLTAGSYVLRVQPDTTTTVRARRRRSPSVCAPTPRTPPANLRQTSARDLDRQDSGNSHEFLQVVGLHRAGQYAHHRKRRAMAQARGAAGSGDFVDATLCVIGDRDRYVNSAHNSPRALGLGP